MRYTLEEVKEKFTYNKTTGIVSILNYSGGKKSRSATRLGPFGYYMFNWKLHGKVVPVLIHRIAYELHNNMLLGPSVIDHKDHNKLNNKPDNLRRVTRAINNRNLGLKKGNKYGCNNIEQLPGGSYRARITVAGKRIPLGTFRNIDDAIAAKHKANKKYGFHENHK